MDLAVPAAFKLYKDAPQENISSPKKVMPEKKVFRYALVALPRESMKFRPWS